MEIILENVFDMKKLVRKYNASCSLLLIHKNS